MKSHPGHEQSTEAEMNLPDVSGIRNVADQCRHMGLSVGAVIIGRESGHDRSGRCLWFHESELTLLWLGKESAVWNERVRSNLPGDIDRASEWEVLGEKSNWSLSARQWRRVLPQYQILRPVVASEAEATEPTVNNVEEDRPKALARHHFADSKVSMVHQTGASMPLSQGMTVTLRYEETFDETRPVCAILHYLDEEGDDDETVVGLTFEDKVLVGYDGVFTVPDEVLGMLVGNGYKIGLDILTDPEEANTGNIKKFADEVRKAAEDFQPIQNVAIGDRVYIMQSLDHDADNNLLGHDGFVEGFITDDHGATDEDPMIKVGKIHVSSSKGEVSVVSDCFWPEELAIMTKAKVTVNEEPLPGDGAAAKVQTPKV